MRAFAGSTAIAGGGGGYCGNRSGGSRFHRASIRFVRRPRQLRLSGQSHRCDEVGLVDHEKVELADDLDRFGFGAPRFEHGHDRGADTSADARRKSWHTERMASPAHVTLAGDLSGEYLVDEVLEDGRLVIRPNTSADAIRCRLGVDPVSREEFERELGHLPQDDEG